MIKQLLLSTALLFLAGIFALGQNSIQGRIYDESGAPLPYASVVITHAVENGIEVSLKSQIGVTSDLDGYYVLPSVPDGSYMVNVIYMGYDDQSFRADLGATVRSVTQDVTMKSQAHDLEEVVVTTQAKGQMAAINQQLSAIAIKNVVAADRIQKNPDANAAEAIGRLPGVSITRSGGEANDVVIRGMPSQYNTVLLNGIEIPSNKGTSRNASLGGISQFSLQGIEVYKAITPDMDANTVSGAVNMQMSTAPEGFHGSVMLQGGYNDQNSDFSNYKFNANLSNRWFDNKFGVALNVSNESTNRSTESLASSYAIETADTALELQPMFLNTVSLQSVERINKRTSGSLVIDYRFSPRSKIEFSNFYSSSPTDRLTISKVHNLRAQLVDFNLNQDRGGHSKLYSGAIRGEHVLGIFMIDYSLAYSQSDLSSEVRSYTVRNPGGYDSGTGTQPNRMLPLGEIIDMANDDPTEESLREYGMGGPGSRNTDGLSEKQYDARLNIKVPIKVGEWLTGNVKFGGMYRMKDRARDYNRYVYGGPPFHKLISGIQTTPDGIIWEIPWVNLNIKNGVSMENMVGGNIDDFLGGRYNFGWYPNIDQMNEIFDWWQDITGYYRPQGRDYVSPEQPGWQEIFGQERMIGWLDPRPSVADDNNVQENQYAGYLMAELKLGNMVSFVPGVRYENTNYDLHSWWLERRLDEALEIPGYPTSATRQNDFLLPMVHLKIKPVDWLNIQTSYTQTIFRPNYNWIVPFEYVDNALGPYEYEAGAPDLNVEKWDNFDLMLAFHSNKLGLISLNGFYKTVSDKIWRRTWTRILSDDPIPPFLADEDVIVTSWYNNNHDTYVRGFEVEWQTNFWYLPKPLSYFTLTANYSYMNNTSVYPDSRVTVEQTGVSGSGRPIYEKVRADSTYTGPMLNQPTHMANVSLGFSYKTFDIWLSYQYIGETLTAYAIQVEFNKYKSAFYRVGLQVKYEIPFKKLQGLEILCNVSNLNKLVEAEYYRGDTRPASLQAYGWTADFGVRYMF
ncbi:MAG: TonB-dependent receptor [Bacteroidetes bacterium]|nr:TonB-dependent receptor [Bacteroidota bacterium]